MTFILCGVTSDLSDNLTETRIVSNSNIDAGKIESQLKHKNARSIDDANIMNLV